MGDVGDEAGGAHHRVDAVDGVADADGQRTATPAIEHEREGGVGDGARRSRQDDRDRLPGVVADQTEEAVGVVDALRAAWQDGDEACVPEHATLREPLAALYDREALLAAAAPALHGEDRSMHGVLARLRQAKSTARVLILTARGEVENRVKGLQAGADDYLAKPFSMDELVARIDALGRRGAAPTAQDLLRVGDLQMDVHHRRVMRAGKAIALSPREFDVLQVLMQEPGRPFSRTELCERVWQRDHEYDTRTVEIFIARLRKKVDAGFAAPLIHTLRAVGYTIRPPE